jgi:hypothetical protein
VPDGWRLRPSRRLVVGAIARRLVPYLVEATIIPTTLFYVLLLVGDLRIALGGALMWSYGAVVRRVVRNRPVPGLLILATIGITVRTIVYLLSNNDFIYFVSPIMRTTLTGLVFAASVVVGRPLIARFAGDFCPLTADVSARPGIRSLFKRLTFLWATVNAAAAASSLALLLTVPVSVFVVTAAVSAWTITCTGVVVTVADSVTTARREGLITAVAPDGRLYAATIHPA